MRGVLVGTATYPFPSNGCMLMITMMNYSYGMMSYASSVSFITLVLLWVLMGLGIAALWKYVTKK